MATSEADAYAMLQRLATAAGFPTVDAYLQKAYDLMTPDQKKKYDDMRAAYSKQSGDVETALFVFGGVATLGILVGLGGMLLGRLMPLTEDSAPTLVKCATNTLQPNLWNLGQKYKTFLRGIEAWHRRSPTQLMVCIAPFHEIHLLTKSNLTYQAGVNDAGEAVEMTELVFEEAAQDAEAGGEGAAEASAALAGARLASKVLGAVALVASIGIIIYDGIEGAKQRDQLRG